MLDERNLMVKKNNLNSSDYNKLVDIVDRLCNINKAISNHLEDYFVNVDFHNAYSLSILVTLNSVSKDIILELCNLVKELEFLVNDNNTKK